LPFDVEGGGGFVPVAGPAGLITDAIEELADGRVTRDLRRGRNLAGMLQLMSEHGDPFVLVQECGDSRDEDPDAVLGRAELGETAHGPVVREGEHHQHVGSLNLACQAADSG
jgi:hypothetical protein